MSGAMRDGVAAGTALDSHGTTDTLISVEDVRGTNFGDTIIGSTAANFLRGRGGDDTIEGGQGDDTLRGEGGDDLFVFNNGDGNDSISWGDFQAGAGTFDMLDVSAFGFASAAAALAAASDDGGGNTLVQLDGDDSVRLIGVAVGSLHEDDFMVYGGRRRA